MCISTCSTHYVTPLVIYFSYRQLLTTHVLVKCSFWYLTILLNEYYLLASTILLKMTYINTCSKGCCMPLIHLSPRVDRALLFWRSLSQIWLLYKNEMHNFILFASEKCGTLIIFHIVRFILYVFIANLWNLHSITFPICRMCMHVLHDWLSKELEI